jgi:hypothetical protein
MGGYNSSRWHAHNKKTTVEECLALRVSDLAKNGFLANYYATGRLEWHNGAFIVTYALKTFAGQKFLNLNYSLGTDSNSREVSVSVGILSTPCHYGGLRWWFCCPGEGCERTTARLYLPMEKPNFACRTCHNLTYQSVQEHDNRVKLCREHPQELAKVIGAAFDPLASSKRKLVFQALGWDEPSKELPFGSIAALDSRGTLKHPDTSASSGLAPCAVQDMGDEASVSRFQNLVAQLFNVMALPRLIKATIEGAQKLGREGYKDREMLYMMTGLLGQKKAGLPRARARKPSRTES